MNFFCEVLIGIEGISTDHLGFISSVSEKNEMGQLKSERVKSRNSLERNKAINDTVVLSNMV